MPERLSPQKIGPFTIGPAVAYVFLVTTVLGWASGLVVGRGIHETIPPVGASFWRWTIVAICLTPFVAPKLKSELPLIAKSWKQLAAMGFFMIGASTISLVAVNFTTATNASLVNATQPMTTALAAWLVLKINLTRIQTLGIIAAAIGLLVMISRADVQVLAGLEFNKGDLIFGVAVFGYAFYATTLQQLPRGIGLTTVLYSVCVFGSLQVLPFYIAESLIYMPVPFSWKTAAALLFLSVLTSLIPVYLWNAANRVVGVNRSGIFVNLLPVFGAVMAIIFLDEQLFAYHIFGAVFVCSGILLMVKGHRDPGT